MDNRQLIMNSALTLFYESGYDAVGVQQIVDSAGVSKPTLYYYFGSKQGLLEALLNEHFQPMEQKLIEASETGKNIPEKLYRIARAFFNGASEDPKFHMLMMALFYSGRKSEGFRTVYPMIDRFYHLCVDVFDNASAELGNMNGRQEQFAVGFSGILMHYLMMTGVPDGRLRRPGRRSLPSGTPVHVWNLLITQKQGGQTKWHHGMKRQNFITSIRSD